MRRRLTPKRLVLIVVLIVLAVLGGLCGVGVGHVASLSIPPGGKLVANHGGYRLYVVPGTDEGTLRTLKEWARKWGNRTSSSYSGYGGNLSLIIVESQGAIVIDDIRYPVPKGHYQVCIHDEKLSFATVWERVKQFLSGRL